MTPEQIDRLLRLTAFEYCDAIWWRLPEGEPDGPLMFLVGCNDVFDWGTADAERINDEADLAGLEAAVREVEALLGRYNGVEGFVLWVARKRKERPQGAMYPHLDPQLWELFDACGPPRDVNWSNPKPQPAGQNSG